MRTMIAGVGYMNLSDSSIGPLAILELKKETWPNDIKVDDLSYGPISVVHNFVEANPRYGRMILITAADFGVDLSEGVAALLPEILRVARELATNGAPDQPEPAAAADHV